MPQRVVAHEEAHLYADTPRTGRGEALAHAVLRLWRSERDQAAAALARAGLSTIDLTALRYLVRGSRDQRDLSPKDLIVMLRSSSATVTNVVERLVTQGLVERVQHPTDRRAHHLVPTEAGIDRVHRAFRPLHSAVVGVVDTLSDDEARCAADVIDKIAVALDGVDSD